VPSLHSGDCPDGTTITFAGGAELPPLPPLLLLQPVTPSRRNAAGSHSIFVIETP
jgi:hypothetical protein